MTNMIFTYIHTFISTSLNANIHTLFGVSDGPTNDYQYGGLSLVMTKR